MTVNISLFAGAGAQFFDNNGVPLAGGLLYTYLAGTTSSVTTYTSSSGSISNPNPIVLDAAGRVPNEIWLTPGNNYKFILQTSSAVQIGSWDNIPSVNDYSILTASNASTLIGYSQGSSYAVSTNVAQKLQQMVSAFDFMTQTQINAIQSGNTGNVDCTTALQNAINYCAPLGKIIFCPAGTYYITSTLVKGQAFYGLNLTGENYGTIFKYPSIASNTSCIQIVGGSGSLCSSVIQGITFTGSSTSIGIEICGQDGQLIRECRFLTNLYGVWFHNRDSGSFTEYCVADNCNFISGCTTAVRYSRDSGDQSFNGTGIRNCTINSYGSSTHPCIIVGDGCLPYNAPLSCQVWGGGTLVRNDNTTYLNCDWYGHITIENGGSPPLVLAVNTNSVARSIYVGTVTATGQYYTLGAMQMYETFVLYTNGGNNGYPQPTYSSHANITNGSLVSLSTVPTPCMATVRLTGAFYQFDYLFYFTRGYGISPYIFYTIVGNPLAFDQAGWGGATFSITGSEYGESLVVHNSSSGFSVTVTIAANANGWGIPDGTGS